MTAHPPVSALPHYFETPLDQALFASAETLIQPPSGTQLPELATGRIRYVLAANGLFIQARTSTIEASVKIAPLPDDLPYGRANEDVRLIHGDIPEAIWMELKHRAVAACPQEWSAYVLCTDKGYQILEPDVHNRSAGHISYTPLAEFRRESLLMHVHSHGLGEAYFSAQDDAADRGSGDGVYLAVVLGRCQDIKTATVAQRLVVWRWLIKELLYNSY